MSKKAYVGINGISKNVKNIYVGVNGVPKKVVKGYVGVNGVAKLFWDGGGSFDGANILVKVSIRNYNYTSVDFSNAVIEVSTIGGTHKPLSLSDYLGIAEPRFISSSSLVISIPTRAKISETANQLTYTYEGTFNANTDSVNKTEFYIGRNTSSWQYTSWKISNIAFARGDAYSFAIDIEVVQDN